MQLKNSENSSEKNGNKEEVLTEKLTDVAFDMIFVKGGSFKMGSNEKTGEQPIHHVMLGDYYMGKYLVTQRLWEAVMKDNPSYFYKCDDCPIESVSWEDIQEFIAKLNKLTGKSYRLPSEAEWEYAAKGGVLREEGNQNKYAGSNNIDEVAWYEENSNGKTQVIGQKKPNELGIYDMSGNVREWCQDKWHDNYEEAPTDGSAWESGESRDRVLRGGSWDFSANVCSVSYRQGGSPVFFSNFDGFRLALSVKQ